MLLFLSHWIGPAGERGKGSTALTPEGLSGNEIEQPCLYEDAEAGLVALAGAVCDGT
jgi:hypothetical protein